MTPATVSDAHVRLRTHRDGRLVLLEMPQLPGTDQHRATLRFPRWDGTHVQTFGILANDGVGNSLTVNTNGLVARGLPSRVKITSCPHDGRPPHVAKVLHAAPTVDVRRHGQWYAVRVRVADNRGVTSVKAFLRTLGVHAPLHRVAGTARCGEWAGRLRVTTCVPGPRSGFLAIVMTDAHQGDVNGVKRLHRTVRVLSKDRTPPFVTTRRYLDAEQRVTSFRFSEPVHGIASDTVVMTDSSDAVVPGSWSCTRPGGASTSCLTGAVRWATFTPDASWGGPGLFLQTVFWEPPHLLSVLDRKGNPVDPAAFFVPVD